MPCTFHQQALRWQGRMKARRAGVRPCQRSGWGWEGDTAMRFPGLVLPRKMNKTKKQPQKPGKQRFPACKTCVPQTAQNAHTDTVWKIKEYRHIYYGIAETSKVYKQHFNPDISVDTNSDTNPCPFLVSKFPISDTSFCVKLIYISPATWYNGVKKAGNT